MPYFQRYSERTVNAYNLRLIFIAEQKRFTYATLKHEIDCLATSFLELGFEKGDRLAVSLPNCSENVVLSYVASKIGLLKVRMTRGSLLKNNFRRRFT